MDVEKIMAQMIDRGPRADKKHMGPTECVTLRACSRAGEADETIQV